VEELVEAARQLLAQRYRAGWHVVGAAVRARSGRIFTAVHLEANVGRVAVCAEAIALGMAVAAGEPAVTQVVAVRHPGADDPDRELKIVSPCGMCREMFSDYAPDARVILQEGGAMFEVPVAELLPRKYS
jgi:cytidine deaminase